MREFVDIKAASGNIRCDKHSNLACFEVTQCFRTRALPFATVNSECFDTVAIQLFGKTICAVLGSCKYEHLSPVAFADLFRQQLSFARLVDWHHKLFDTISR